MPHPYPPPGQPPWAAHAGNAPPGWSAPPYAWSGSRGWGAQPPAWTAGPGWASPPPAWSGVPAWGAQQAAWSAGSGWASPPPAWSGGPGWGAQQAAWRAVDPYPSAGWSYAQEPIVVEWTAILEPALDAVLPAIQGLLELSGRILSSLPAALEIPPTSSGLGHLGLFGAAEADDPEDGEERAEA